MELIQGPGLAPKRLEELASHRLQQPLNSVKCPLCEGRRLLLLKQHRRGGRIALGFASSFNSPERVIVRVEVKGTAPSPSKSALADLLDPPRGRVVVSPSFMLRCTILLLSFFTIFTANLSAQNLFDEREQNLVSGLRDRSLFDLAEKHCAEFLNREGLTSTDIATIAIERISNKAAQIRTANDRESIAAAIDKIANDFTNLYPDHPKSTLVTMQQALAHVSYASLLQQEIEARIDGVRQRERGLQQLTIARRLLDEAKKRNIDTLQAQSNQTVTSDMLTREQLRALKTNLEYQQAIVNLTSAQLADTSSDAGRLDRIDSLGRVPEQLISVRGMVAQSSQLWWRTWIREASCRRMLGEFQTASRILNSLKRDKCPKAVLPMWTREEIELAIALGDKNQMLKLANRMLTKRHDPTTEVALVRLLVAAGDIEKASAMVDKIGANYGAWWDRRAGIALLSGNRAATENTIGSNSTGNSALDSANLTVLFEAAERAERNGDLAAAGQGYLSVAESQFSSGDRANGLTTSVRAALTFEKQHQHQRAAEILLKPSRAHPNETASPSIFLRGCWNLSRAKSPQYASALQAMMRTWPESKSTDQARYWLGVSQLSNKQYADAFKTLLAIAPDFKDMSVAISFARAAARRQLDDQSERRAMEIAKQMLADWSSFYDASPDSQKPAVANAMAELSLVFSAEDDAKTRQRMEGLKNVPAASENLEFQYLSALLADDEESNRLLTAAESSQFDPSTVERFLQLIEKLDASQRIAEIQLRIATDALSKAADAKLKRQLSNTRAAALVTLGRRDEAEAIYRQMMKDDPKDQAAIVELARVLSGDESLKIWRRIASRAAAHTDIWYEAKFNVARLLHESGKRDEAAKMLKYIKAVPPGWDRSSLKAQFETLLLQCTKS